MKGKENGKELPLGIHGVIQGKFGTAQSECTLRIVAFEKMLTEFWSLTFE